VNIWFELSYKNKIIIISLLNGPIRRIDIAKYLNVKSGSLSSNLKELENLSLIQKSEDNLYSISEPLLKKWLKSEFNEKGEYPFTII
jgi:predicted transcriptional regulator